jgi:hypothetical protein
MRKMKFVSVFVLLALLLGGILPVVKAEAEIEVARESAGSFIAKAVRSFPEWEGATPMDAQIYHDLNGQTSAYMFTVSKDRESRCLTEQTRRGALQTHTPLRVSYASA